MQISTSKRGTIRGKRQESLVGYLFCMPSFIGFIAFVLIPVIYAAVLSFSKINLFTNASSFVGMKNYLSLMKTPRFATVLGNTLWYMVVATTGNTVAGLLLALAVNNKLGRKTSIVFRAMYFFPSLVGLVFVSIIWQYLFQADMGIINYYLGKIGIPKIAWLSSPDWCRISVVILDVWKNAGMSMLLILAGLQNINISYYEAARIDGASAWKTFWKITLPSLSPTLFFVVVMHMTGALRIFESVSVLTGGGPGDSSRSLVMFITERAFASYDYGVASAASMVLLLMIALFTLIQFVGSKGWVHYE